MASIERVTVSLPDNLLREIDRRERNRSKFVAEAVRREIERRRHAELRRSLENPHPDTTDLVQQGFDEWAHNLPEEDADSLVTGGAGKAVRWVPGEGWVEDRS
ncbi:MAG: hypothetical protein IT169_12845 [Bryobacterales bacterium]|nr:hypothetical protein [Bryobacterales bacterium]